jgi:hypothetical protein
LYFSVLFVLFHLQNPQNTKLYFSAGLRYQEVDAREGKTGRAGGGRSWPVRREGGSKGDGRRGPRPPRRASLAGVRIHHPMVIASTINPGAGGRGTLLITYCCFTIHSGRRWRRSAVENSICTTSQLASNSSSPETPRGECFNFNR